MYNSPSIGINKRIIMKKIFLLVCLLALPGTLLTMDNDLIVEIRQRKLNNELIEAVKRNSAEGVKTLLDKGADVNAQTKNFGQLENDYSTALMVAADRGRVDCVKVLVEKGADISARDIEERTALILAAVKGHGTCVKILADAGADIDAQDELGWTALRLAAESGAVACVKTLLNEGADVNVPAKHDNSTALMLAAYNGHVACTKILLETGADANAQAVGNRLALHLAAAFVRTDCVKLLVRPWSVSGVRERINVVRALLDDRLGADNYLHAKILLSAKELKENVILVLLGEIAAENKEVFLDPVFSLVRNNALEFVNKHLHTCEKIQSSSEIKDEIKSLCNTEDIEKMKERISEYEAQIKYKSNDNEKEFSDTE